MTAIRFAIILGLLAAIDATVSACPFCRAVSETVSDRLELAEVVLIARQAEAGVHLEKASGERKAGTEKAGTEKAPGEKPAAGAPRTHHYTVVEVLKGKELLAGAMKIAAPPLADVPAGAKLLILGARDKKTDQEIFWLAPRVISDPGIEYVRKLPSAAPKTQPLERLAYFQEHLNDAEDLIADDAYDEIARAPFADVKALAPRMHRDRLLAWVQDGKISALRRRQYLTLLSVCGRAEDAAVLEKLVAAEHGGPDGALDATTACYLTLAGEKALTLIERQFIQNTKATSSDGQAIAAALRFHGEEEKVIPRSRLLATQRMFLERATWADLVMPELARWEDWSAMPRLVRLFHEAEKALPSEAAVFALRVPIIRYLRVCPLPEAKQRLAELEKSHPQVVRAADIYPFLPATLSGSRTPDGATRRAKTGDAKDATKSVDSEKTPAKMEADPDDGDPTPAKNRARRPAKAKAKARVVDQGATLPTLRTGLGVFLATTLMFGLVVAVLFGFRAKR